MPLTCLQEIENIVGKPVYIRRPSPEIYSVHYAEPKNQQEIARFSLKQLPGCCGICVSFHANVSTTIRKKGIGSLLNKIRQQIAWNNGYTILLCTDVEKNEPQQKILNKNGWQKIMTFNNRRTHNKVCLHSITLKDLGIKIGHGNIDLSPAK